MALGVLVAIAVGRLMGDFLMGVGPTDPLTYSIVSALLGVVALLACYVPVRRVLSGDPLVALRHE
jgi:putative ABC transport system permease protein